MFDHPLHWIYGKEIMPGSASCWFCAISCIESQKRLVSQVIGDAFNDHDQARCSSSPVLCEACSAYFHDSRPWRQASWKIHKNGAEKWQREQMRNDLDMFFSGKMVLPVVLSVTTSYKKHHLIRAPINYGNQVALVQYEQQLLSIESPIYRGIFAAIDGLMALGHNKSEIASGMLHPIVLKRHGKISEALTISQQLQPYRGSELLEFLLFITIIPEKKAEDHARNGSDPSGSESAHACVARHQQRLQKQVSADHLGAIPEQDRDGGQDQQYVATVHQSSLFDAE